MIVVFLLFSIYSIFHFKKAVLITASTFIYIQNLNSGIPGMKFLYGICLLHILLFLREKSKNYHKYPIYLSLPCTLAALGYIISSWLGVTNSLSITIVNCLCYFLYPLCVWRMIENRNDLNFFLRIYLLFFLLIGVYAIVEMILKVNIVTDYLIQHNIVEAMYGEGELRERFGFARCHSLLPYSSALGMTASAVTFVCLYLNTIKVRIYKRIQISLMILMPFCVLLSGTRSQFVVFVLCLFPFIFWNKFFTTKAFKILVLGVMVVIIFFSENISLIVESILYSNKVMMGSTTDLRMEQFDICYYYFLKNPIWGFGRNYIWQYIRPENPALLGAESVWLQIMVDYGIVGCITYLLVCVGASILLFKKNKVLGFFPLAFLVGKTLSIVIGIELSFMLIITIILYKTHEYYGGSFFTMDKIKTIINSVHNEDRNSDNA